MRTHREIALIFSFAATLGLYGPSQAQSPTGSDASVRGDRANTLVLHPGDVLRVSVWPDEALSGEFAVEESGLVHVPALGAIQVAGVPLDRLRAELRQRYGEGMRNPVVTVTPLFHVGVLGAVRQPGIYTVTPTHTFFDVIGMAGGFGGEANQQDVRVVREGEVVRVDALRALEEGQGLDALQLRSGDQIVIPQRSGGIDLRTVLSILQTAATAALVIDRLGN